MRYRIHILMLCLLTLYCGRLYQDPAFRTYINDFETTYNVDTSNIVVSFTDSYAKDLDFPDEVDPEKVIGICETRLTGKYITILRSYWERANPISKRMLIYHELGHCALDRDHDDATFPDGCPHSIMSSQMAPSECLHKHRGELLLELSSYRALLHL